jgi:NhaA family Na+:H+ antiporter
VLHQHRAASGIVLLAAAALALMWANSPVAPSYAALWHLNLSFRVWAVTCRSTTCIRVNDG